MAEEMMMVPTADYNNLVNYYKGRLTESALLNKASRLAAERQLVLENPKIPTSLALAVAEPKAREVQRLTKRLRSAGVSRTSTVCDDDDDDDHDDDDEDDFLKTPLDSRLDKILRVTEKTLKQQRPPLVPQTKRRKLPKTPQKQPVKTEQASTSKKSGWISSMTHGALKGSSMGVNVSRTSDSEDEGATRPKKKKPTPKAVKRLRAAPGWEDFTEGKQLRRALLSDYEEEEEEEEDEDED